MAKQNEIDKEKPRDTRALFFAILRGLLVMVLLIIMFSLQALEIPSISMEDTLLIGDHVFVNRAPFAPATRWLGPLLPNRKIRRGDIVVFLSPEETGLLVVNRVIGIPGDKIHLRDGVVYRNGEKQDEPYVRHKRADFNPYRDDFPAVPPSEMYGVRNQEWALSLPQHIEGDDLVVPANTFFGMGDSRDVSYDSRYYGFVPLANVTGRPMFIYWSFKTPPDQYEKREIGDRVAFLGHIIIHFFDETRWSRSFKAVR